MVSSPKIGLDAAGICPEFRLEFLEGFVGRDPLDVSGRLELKERCRIVDGVVGHGDAVGVQNKLGMQIVRVMLYLAIFMSLI